MKHVEYGPLSLGVEELSRARGLSAELGFQTYDLNIASYLGYALVQSGDPAPAIEVYETAIARCRQLRFVEGEADGLYGIACACLVLGRPEEAIEHAERALAIARKVSAHLCELNSLITLGSTYLELGRVDAAEACLGQARRMSEDAGLQIEVDRVDVLLAAGHRLRGDYELALRTVPDASAGGPWCGPVLAELARIYLAMGDVPSAVEQATKAVRLSRACGYRVDEERARQVLVSAMKQE